MDVFLALLYVVTTKTIQQDVLLNVNSCSPYDDEKIIYDDVEIPDKFF